MSGSPMSKFMRGSAHFDPAVERLEDEVVEESAEEEEEHDQPEEPA